jgi:hypothetical protein
MMKVTLDTNSIVDLEQNNEWAPYIRELVQMHKDRKIHLRIVAMSASERKPNRTYSRNFDEFKKRINRIGLSDAEILKPICYWDVSFWDCCVWSDETTSKLEKDIHRVLFPTIEFEYAKYCKSQGLNEKNTDAYKKWLNAKCDVLILWSHIWYKGDFFVTRDKRFFRKTKKLVLARLGAKEILCPDEAVFKLRQQTR